MREIILREPNAHLFDWKRIRSYYLGSDQPDCSDAISVGAIGIAPCMSASPHGLHCMAMVTGPGGDDVVFFEDDVVIHRRSRFSLLPSGTRWHESGVQMPNCTTERKDSIFTGRVDLIEGIVGFSQVTNLLVMLHDGGMCDCDPADVVFNVSARRRRRCARTIADAWISYKARRVRACCVIQRAWRHVYYSPAGGGYKRARADFCLHLRIYREQNT